jgi:tetratricopeptide (TPR) repeat protein
VPFKRLLVAVFFLSLLPQIAQADKEKAKQLFMKGMAQYKLEHYDEAIADFEAAYQEEQSPVLLFNIAQANRLAKRPKQALSFSRKYLRETPEAQNRAQVEKEMATLEEEVKELDADDAAQRQREAEARQAINQPPPPPPSSEKPKSPS